jgi:tetratricopeptide (TPR) repeat protein
MSEPDASNQPTIQGVFSSEKTMTIGFGATKRRVKQNVYSYVKEEDGKLAVQPLNDKMVPVGAKTYISREELLKSYLPEPAVYLNTVLPNMVSMEQAVARGDAARERGELYTAEYDYKTALDMNEEHVRAVFGLGLVYLERGDDENAVKIFQKLVKIDAAFHEDHKHLFNEFGIKLRKRKLYPQALKFYSRAYHLSRQDDHLLFNLSRTLYEKGRPTIAARFLRKSLAINPDFEESRQFLNHLERKFPDASKTRLDLDDPPFEE